MTQKLEIYYIETKGVATRVFAVLSTTKANARASILRMYGTVIDDTAIVRVATDRDIAYLKRLNVYIPTV